MSKNGPDGTLFSPDGAVLDQDHTLLFSLALLPPCRIAYTDSCIVTQSSESGDIRRTHAAHVGVNGGLEEAKKCVCEMIDRMWEQRC